MQVKLAIINMQGLDLDSAIIVDIFGEDFLAFTGLVGADSDLPGRECCPFRDECHLHKQRVCEF